MKVTKCLLPLLAALICCCQRPAPAPGVSRTLAIERKAQISELEYHLWFYVPDSLREPCRGKAEISFCLKERKDVILDFRPGAESLEYVCAGGDTIKAECLNEHIIIPARHLKRGRNSLQLGFTPDDASLNRHAEYLYTLLVPERSRTVFPCFDQPDLKAVFTLEADIPDGWVAVSNGPVSESTNTGGRTHISFSKSGLISTYLFEFCAGKWQTRSWYNDGHPMTVYYRETDPAKVAQLDEIQRQVVYALKWMEEFTGIPMPFEKYDYVIVPGFQFGGMEHPGAILFNDTRMFLGEAPTDNDRLARTDLISHETSHLWFGDAVTMEWFNDVWTKEVFANYFAARIARPFYPNIDFRLRDFRNFNIPAYEEDRSAGSVPLLQELDNLANAGLIYGNIVYDKAPVVMRMLADTLGPEAFRAGMREYLGKYMYGNATWPALIDILDRHSQADIKDWSRRWVAESGMSEYAPSDSLQNLSALGYGYYPLTAAGLERALEATPTLPQAHQRLSALATLYEHLLRGKLGAETFADCVESVLGRESNQMVAAAALNYLSKATSLGCPRAKVEDILLGICSKPDAGQQIRLTAFRHLAHIFERESTSEMLMLFWQRQQPYSGLTLQAEDYTTLAMELAIRRPQDYDLLYSTQRSRIGNPDRLERFDFVFPSVHPSKQVRDSVFQSLLKAENRRTEPWAESALANLNHPLRQAEAIGYIVPALDELENVQRTGDIFFPKDWLNATLAGHSSPEAAAAVRGWIDAHPGYPPLLMSKLLQSADILMRANQ